MSIVPDHFAFVTFVRLVRTTNPRFLSLSRTAIITYTLIGGALLGIIGITRYRNHAPLSYERNGEAKAAFWACVGVLFLAVILVFTR
jgi:hypothetical protein